MANAACVLGTCYSHSIELIFNAMQTGHTASLRLRAFLTLASLAAQYRPHHSKNLTWANARFHRLVGFNLFNIFEIARERDGEIEIERERGGKRV